MPQVLEEPTENAPAEAEKDSVFLREITLTNLLSFGPDTPPLALGPLNVLIGANGSGKSNLIEAISLLRAAPKDFQAVTRQGGGVEEWIWKGKPDANAEMQAVLTYPTERMPLRHKISFAAQNQAFKINSEVIENERSYKLQPTPVQYYQYSGSNPVMRIDKTERTIQSVNFNSNKSVLSQIRDAERYLEISYIADNYDKIRIYRDWQFGRNSILRRPQAADLPTDMLEEDFSNLALFLSQIRQDFSVRRKMNGWLRNLLEGFEELDFSIKGGTVQLFLHEGGYNIPASRLSDGTLRYLSLLAILCDPTPPPLICLEEPELGLHPDLFSGIADLLVEASKRTQLIVTTHSRVLVDALTPTPEAVFVCEKHQGKTEIKRLAPEEICIWLDKYGLGELWISGELGGNRW